MYSITLLGMVLDMDHPSMDFNKIFEGLLHGHTSCQGNLRVLARSWHVPWGRMCL